MTTDFRALCAELVDALDSGIPAERIRMSPLADRARAALSEPEPEGPTDKELADMYWQYYHWAPKRSNISAHAYALRAVLARWGS